MLLVPHLCPELANEITILKISTSVPINSNRTVTTTQMNTLISSVVQVHIMTDEKA